MSARLRSLEPCIAMSTRFDKAMGLPAVVLALFLASLAIASAPASAQCRLEQTFAERVAPTKADLDSTFVGCGAFREAWFDVATDPSFAGAVRVKTWRYDSNSNNGLLRGTATGLMPQTLHYFRAHLRTSTGDVLVDEGQPFRTPALSDVVGPECRHENRVPRIFNGRDGIQIKLQCNSHGYGGVLYFLVGTAADMADARQVGTDGFFKALPFEIPFSFFLAYDDYPDGAIVHVQVRVENNVGSAHSEIVAVTLNRNRPVKGP